jgi:hypothetical protein
MNLVRTAAAAFLISSASFAQIPITHRLSPEISVSQPTSVRAPGTRYLPVAASNGTDYLVVWFDTRVHMGSTALFAARVSSAGVVLDPTGIPIGTANTPYTFPDVTWTGSDYLVVWSNNNRAHAVRVLPDGRLRDLDPKVLHSEFLFTGFTSNGRESLLLTRDEFGVTWGTVLDQNLDQRGPRIPLTSGAEEIHASAAGEVFMFLIAHAVESSQCPDPRQQFCYRTWIGRLSLQAQHLGKTEISVFPNPYILPELESDGGSEFLLAYSGSFERGLWVNRITAAGEIGPRLEVHPSVRVDTTYFANGPDIVWTGSNFAIAWALRDNGEDAIWLATVNRTGTVVQDLRRLSNVGTTTTTPTIAYASGTGRLFATWMQLSPQPVGSYPILWELTFKLADQPAGTFLTHSAIQQESPVVASAQGTHLAVWTDLLADQTRILRAARFFTNAPTFDGQGIEIQRFSTPSPGIIPAAVASDGESFLILWESDFKLFSRRLARDGTWIDAAARDTGITACSITQQSLIWNGERYFLVQTCDSVISGIHLDQTGLPSGPEVNISPLEAYVSNAAVAFDGRDYMLVWTDGDSPFCPILCPGPRIDIYSARVTREGLVLDNPARRLTLSGQNGFPSIAWGGERYLVTWTGQNGIHGTRLTPEGIMIDGSPESDGVTIVKLQQRSATRAIFDRAAFVVFWREPLNARRAELRGLRIDPIEPFFPGSPMPFVMSSEFAAGHPNPESTSPPAAAESIDGVVIVYTRVAPSPSFGSVKRIFARILKSPPFRSRGARR